MADRPARQRSGSNIWQWVIGFIVLLVVLWIINGMMGNGTGDDTMTPPFDQEPVPEEQQPEEPPQQEPQQDPPQDPQSGQQSHLQKAMPGESALLANFTITALPGD